MIPMDELGYLISYMGIELVRGECKKSRHDSEVIPVWVSEWSVGKYHQMIGRSDVSVLRSTHLLGRWIPAFVMRL